MVEYPIDEALDLLNSNKEQAEKKLSSTETVLEFVRGQIVTTQVSANRLHNWNVKRKQAK